MINFYKFLKIISILIGVGGVLLAMILSEQRYSARRCHKIHIVLQPPSDQEFITEEKVLSLVTESSKKPILNTLMKNIQTGTFIKNLQNDSFVKNVVVYKTWQGVLKIIVSPKKALARVIVGDVKDRYIDEEGDYIPTSSYHTARVLLVEVNDSASLADIVGHRIIRKKLLTLLQHIREDVFLRAQIAHIRLKEIDKIIMYPRIGKQVIEFGKLECIAKKCTKLKYFYNAVIPYKGWDAYSRVNLEFDNQIVCE